MAADTKIDGTPTVSPDSVNASSPSDVWFQYSLTNSGDADGTSTGYYVTLDDRSGANYHSDYAPDETIPAGGTIQQGVKIESSVIGGLVDGEYWVSLRSPSGDTIGASLLTVVGSASGGIQLTGAPSLSPDSVSASNPGDVWFQYTLTNTGHQGDTSTGYYVTVQDHSGTVVHSDYAPTDNIGAGASVGQGVKIESSVIGGLAAGDYWVNLHAPSGDNIGGAALTVTQ